MLMPGHLLLYHPGVIKLKDLVDSEELGRLLYVYGNRQNLGQIRKDENALWSLGAHDLSVILHLVGEEPSEAWARGESFLNPGVEDVVFCYLRFPSGVVAHMHLSWLDPHKMRRMTVVGDRKMAVFDDMEPERKVTVYDKGPQQPAETWGEWQTRSGDISIPKVANDEPLRLECEHFLALLRGEGDRIAAARDGLAVVRALEQLQKLARAGTCVNRIAETAVVYPGVEFGEDVVVGDYAVVGKQPVLGRRSTASRGGAPAARRRRRQCNPRWSGRLRGHSAGLGRHRGRPGVCPRALRARGRGRRRPRRSRRERHDDRRAREDPGECLRDGVHDRRGGRLHRAVCRDDERQLHGTHRDSATSTEEVRRSAAARGSAGAPSCSRGSRSARRRSSVPGPSSSRMSRRGRSWSGTRRARSATCPTKNCSVEVQDRRDAGNEPARGRRREPRPIGARNGLEVRVPRPVGLNGRGADVLGPFAVAELRSTCTV